MSRSQLILLAAVSSSAAVLFFLGTKTGNGLKQAESNTIPAAHRPLTTDDDDTLETTILDRASMSRIRERRERTDKSEIGDFDAPGHLVTPSER